MALEIPNEDKGAITRINKLPAASVDKLIATIKAAPLTSDPGELAAYIAKRAPSLAGTDLERLLNTLFTLYHIRELASVPLPRFLDDLMDGLRASDANIPPKEYPKLAALLNKLMSIENLNTVAKAARLQRDGERLYCNSKILSDIRPVFGPDPAAKPLGAVLTHALKIGYHEGSEHKEFHVVLDADDLDALGKGIARAQAKDSSLRRLLDDAGLSSLDS